jgi:hypothetical protein
MTFVTRFEFPGYKSARSLSGIRYWRVYRGIFQETKSIGRETKVSTFRAGDTETATVFSWTGYAGNVVTRKVAVHSPFDIPVSSVPILPVCKLRHNAQKNQNNLEYWSILQNGKHRFILIACIGY